jgi:TRAP-type C4-dicarboxylate transport system substrate-binding protein
MEQAWKITGFQVIPNDLKDLLMALQSGMVDAFYLPPLIAGSGQYFPLAPHMCSLKVAPIIGGIVITNRVWNQVPEPFKKSMLDATNRLAASLRIKIRKLEKETLETMIENGLVINQVQPDAVEKWREAPAKGIEYLIGKSFSKETYDQVQAYLKEYRDRNAAGKNK